MLLIAESGSTKTDWCLVDAQQNRSIIQSPGFNPLVQSLNEIASILDATFSDQSFKNGVQNIFFYGAGCGQSSTADIIKSLLKATFTNATISVESDLLAAAKACCGNQPGIVGILGTGSNACYFDGKTATTQTASLGYLLGDEGSGTYIGRKLLQSFFYHEMPDQLQQQFVADFQPEKVAVLQKLRTIEAPQAYLASFASFAVRNSETIFIRQLVQNAFAIYLEKHILPHSRTNQVPVHFVGSIAFLFKGILRSTAFEKSISIGTILQKPVDALVNFHMENQNND